MDLSEAQQKLDEGLTVARVQIWLTGPGDSINDSVVLKSGFSDVAAYVNSLSSESLRACRKKDRAAHELLPLCTIGTLKDGVKTLLAYYENEVPPNVDFTFG